MAGDAVTGPAEGVVAGYLAALAAQLPGPPRYRRRVLTEIRDGMWEATRAHGGDAAAAVAEFGDPGRVAAGFAEEAAAAQVRRTARAFLVTGPLVGIWWLLALSPSGPPPALPLVGLGALAAVTALAATGRLSRRLPVTGRHTLAATMLTAAACFAGDLIMLGVLAAHAAATPATLPWALAVGAAAASLVRLGYAPRALSACVRARRALAS